MVTEDFSFPTVTNPVAPFSISPWLRHIPSRVFSDYCDVNTVRGEEDCSRNSSPYIETEMKSKKVDASELCEEKMDKLWEDFNEELLQTSVTSWDDKKKKEEWRSCVSDFESNTATEAMVESCRVRTLKMSKTSSGMVSSKRPSMVAVFKILKKLLLLHNSTLLKKTHL